MSKKDLFDDTTMTFGEHLEVLRIHLWKAIIGLVIGTTVGFFLSRPIIVAIQVPVVEALKHHFGQNVKPEGVIEKGFVDSVKDWWDTAFKKTSPAEEKAKEEKTVDPRMKITVGAREIATRLHEFSPASYPAPPENAEDATIEISFAHTPFAEYLSKELETQLYPRTDGVDEAFMVYLKVSLVVGVIISSPWVFYQIWLFVGAGLYPHERKYVYTYLPISIIPIGRPSLIPQGMLIAGCPDALNGAVLGTISKARWI